MSASKPNIQVELKETIVRLPEYASTQNISQSQSSLSLPKAISEVTKETKSNQDLVSAQSLESYRLECLGFTGRLKERTLGSALTLTSNTAELLCMVGLSLYSEVPHRLGITRLLGITEEKLREHQVKRLEQYQKFFDEVSPNGSIMSTKSGKDPLFSESALGTGFNILSQAFGVVTYPTTLLINLAIGTIGTLIEEADRSIVHKGCSYSEYLKSVEENPSVFRDTANLAIFVAINFLTIGKARVSMNMALRCQSALTRMLPAVGMGTAGALGEQLMRVGDEQTGGFNTRALVRDAIQGWLSSSLFSLGMRGVRSQAYREFADMADGASDLLVAGGESSRLELENEKLSLSTKVIRGVGLTFKLGTAVYDLRNDSKPNSSTFSDEQSLRLPKSIDINQKVQEQVNVIYNDPSQVVYLSEAKLHSLYEQRVGKITQDEIRGFYDQRTNKFYINNSLSQEEALATISHELRHRWGRLSERQLAKSQEEILNTSRNVEIRAQYQEELALRAQGLMRVFDNRGGFEITKIPTQNTLADQALSQSQKMNIYRQISEHVQQSYSQTEIYDARENNIFLAKRRDFNSNVPGNYYLSHINEVVTKMLSEGNSLDAYIILSSLPPQNAHVIIASLISVEDRSLSEQKSFIDLCIKLEKYFVFNLNSEVKECLSAFNFEPVIIYKATNARMSEVYFALNMKGELFIVRGRERENNFQEDITNELALMGMLAENMKSQGIDITVKPQYLDTVNEGLPYTATKTKVWTIYRAIEGDAAGSIRNLTTDARKLDHELLRLLKKIHTPIKLEDKSEEVPADLFFTLERVGEGLKLIAPYLSDEIFSQLSISMQHIAVYLKSVSPSEVCFIHGDYHHGNVITDKDRNVKGIIDFNDCRLGIPIDDLIRPITKILRADTISSGRFSIELFNELLDAYGELGCSRSIAIDYLILDAAYCLISITKNLKDKEPIAFTRHLQYFESMYNAVTDNKQKTKDAKKESRKRRTGRILVTLNSIEIIDRNIEAVINKKLSGKKQFDILMSCFELNTEYTLDLLTSNRSQVNPKALFESCMISISRNLFHSKETTHNAHRIFEFLYSDSLPFDATANSLSAEQKGAIITKAIYLEMLNMPKKLKYGKLHSQLNNRNLKFLNRLASVTNISRYCLTNILKYKSEKIRNFLFDIYSRFGENYGDQVLHSLIHSTEYNYYNVDCESNFLRDRDIFDSFFKDSPRVFSTAVFDIFKRSTPEEREILKTHWRRLVREALSHEHNRDLSNDPFYPEIVHAAYSLQSRWGGEYSNLPGVLRTTRGYFENEMSDKRAVDVPNYDESSLVYIPSKRRKFDQQRINQLVQTIKEGLDIDFINELEDNPTILLQTLAEQRSNLLSINSEGSTEINTTLLDQISFLFIVINHNPTTNARVREMITSILFTDTSTLHGQFLVIRKLTQILAAELPIALDSYLREHVKLDHNNRQLIKINEDVDLDVTISAILNNVDRLIAPIFTELRDLAKMYEVLPNNVTTYRPRILNVEPTTSADSFLARYSHGVDTESQITEWQDPYFFQAVIKDRVTAKVRGNISFNVFTTVDTQEYGVVIRLNPQAEMITPTYVRNLLRSACTIAINNNLIPFIAFENVPLFNFTNVYKPTLEFTVRSIENCPPIHMFSVIRDRVISCTKVLRVDLDKLLS